MNNTEQRDIHLLINDSIDMSTLTKPKVRVPWRLDLRSMMLLILVLAVGFWLSLQIETF